MSELINIKSYDVFMGDLLNEDLIHGEQSICNKAFLNGGTITFADGGTVEPKEIIKVVDEACRFLTNEYSRTFSLANNTLNIIYLSHSKEIQTMAVDGSMNLYVNAGYVYNTLKMNPKYVAAVLMHEVLHIIYNHIERGKNWLSANGKPNNKENWHDTNLAADIEVNHTLVKLDIVTRNEIINDIHALYLDHAGERGKGRSSVNYDILPMEMILENEEYMNILRKMAPPPVDPERKPQEVIKTSDEWNQGYKDAWNKIAGLIKKYGAQGTWDKLMESGIINGVGELMTDKIKDVNKLELITVSSYEDFIGEGEEKNETGQTYDDGFNTAVGKLVNSLKRSLQGGDQQGGGGGGGPKLKSDMKDDELDKITLPEPPGGSGNGEENDDGNELPENIEQSGKGNGNGEGKDKESNGGNDNEGNEGNEGSQDGKQSKSKSAGKGGKGKSSDQLTDDDSNALENDLAKSGGKSGDITDESDIIDGKSKKHSDGNEGSERNNGNEKGDSIGGTGSFHDKGFGDKVLKDAGYSDEDIRAINEVRKQNAERNTTERIKKEIATVKRKCKEKPVTAFISKYMDEFEKQSEKYRNIWKKILEQFMAKKTRRAGSDTPTGYNDWKNKRTIARGEYGIHHRMESQDPQDVNVYVDVSGSIDMELLKIITKTLIGYTQEWEYSGINICPWASKSCGVFKIEDFYSKTEVEIAREIMKAISDGQAMCGFGTEGDAMISAVLDAMEESLKDENKDAKDDIHIVITDGYFDVQNIEERMKATLKAVFKRNDIAMNAPDHTVWMLYDTEENYRKIWTNEIKNGKLIFLNTDVVKNNR